MSPEDQAYQFMREAEKKLNSKSSFLSLFTSAKSRIDDAIELYQKAGNFFKLSKNLPQAGAAFKLAAELHRGQNNRIDSALNYTIASKCYEKHDATIAIKFLLNAIEIYTDLGRFVMAAKLHNRIADIYEDNLELEKALQHYEQAADYFKVEESFTSAKKCLLKVAQYASAEFNDFVKAASIFQEVAFYDLQTPLLRYHARDLFFRAALCHLCVDVVNARQCVDTYVEKCPAFEDSREFVLITKLIGSVEDDDEDAFTAAISEFDGLSRLDTWQTKMLLRVKQQMKEPNLL